METPTLTKLHNPEDGQMRIAGFMSGSGSNLRKIIDQERQLQAQQGRSPYTVAVIFSDIAESNATKIGKDYDLPVVTHDSYGFYKRRGHDNRPLSLRPEFDAMTLEALRPYQVSVAALAGYMLLVTKPILDAYNVVNVHPADLSIKIEKDGKLKPKYVGMNAVRDAILAGETLLRSTTHVAIPDVDEGGILMRSQGVKVDLPAGFDASDESLVQRVADGHQGLLKEVGDWVIFPRTLLYMAQGRYARDEQGKLYFDDKSIPHGIRAEDVL